MSFRGLVCFGLVGVGCVYGAEQLISSPKSSGNRVSAESVCSSLNTGDLVLYASDSTRYKNPWLRAQIFCTKVLTKSRFDHCGFLLRISDNGKITLDNNTGTLYVLEATVKGPTLFRFEDRVRSYRASDISVRALNGVRCPEMTSTIHQYMKDIEARPYSTCYRDLILAGYSTPSEKVKAAQVAALENMKSLSGSKDVWSTVSRTYRSAYHDFGYGSLQYGHPQTVKERLSAHRLTLLPTEQKTQQGTIFCSELVAELYQRLGVLSPDWPPAHKYSPGDFTVQRQFRCAFTDGYSLGSQIPIELPTPPDRATLQRYYQRLLGYVRGSPSGGVGAIDRIS
mmetsp:Transcript_24966/g.41137  ORF Transcript_24966/g.41137 Transcript_24966/m.41137 type:complete len:339 (+) Transcript_24966:87-1103(+)